MHGWQNRDWIMANINPRKSASNVLDAGKPRLNQFWRKVIQAQMQMVFFRTTSAPRHNFLRQCPRNNIPRCQLHGIRRITSHKPLPAGISEIRPFAARALGYQHPITIKASRMKLDKLHILQGNSRSQSHRRAIACADTACRG